MKYFHSKAIFKYASTHFQNVHIKNHSMSGNLWLMLWNFWSQLRKIWVSDEMCFSVYASYIASWHYINCAVKLLVSAMKSLNKWWIMISKFCNLHAIKIKIIACWEISDFRFVISWVSYLLVMVKSDVKIDSVWRKQLHHNPCYEWILGKLVL